MTRRDDQDREQSNESRRSPEDALERALWWAVQQVKELVRESTGQRPRSSHTDSRPGEPDATDAGEAYEDGIRHGPHAGKGPKGYTRSADRLREVVCERLKDSTEVDASDIEVSVAVDEITLEGTVGDRYQKRLAEDVAESVSGVHDVHNRLTINRSDR